MTRESLDPIRDKMIAALYGELSAEEERDLQAHLAQSDELRAEWEELQEAHGFLGAAEEEETTPSFVFAAAPDSSAASRRRASRASAAAGHHGFWTRWRAFWQTPVPGLAVVTAALVVLVVAGLRVDREGGALIVRFGSPPATMATTTAQLMAPGVGEGLPLEPGSYVRAASSPDDAAQLPSDVSGVAVSNLGGYLTRAEFVAFARQVNDLLESQLSDEQSRRRAELAYVARSLYDEMTEDHRSDYEELNGRIQQVWYGLASVDAREGEPSRLTPNQEQPRGINPVQRSMNDSR